MAGIKREQLEAVGARFISIQELIDAGVDPEILKINLFFTGYPDGLPKSFGFDEKTQACSFRTETGAPIGTATEFVIYPKGSIDDKPTDSQE